MTLHSDDGFSIRMFSTILVCHADFYQPRSVIRIRLVVFALYWAYFHWIFIRHIGSCQDKADKKRPIENRQMSESMMHRIDETTRGLMTDSGSRTSVSAAMNGVRNVMRRL